MSMKYINATAACFKSVSINNNKIVSYNAPFNQIHAVTENDTPVIDSFSIVTQIDFLGTDSSLQKADNPLEMRTTEDFIIRLTKCDPDEANRLGRDLDSFSIDLAEMYEKERVDRACLDFLSYTRITNVKKLDLPKGAGEYVIKILIKDAEDEDYSIQSIMKLTVA